MTSLLVVFVVLAALGQTRGLRGDIARGGKVSQSSVVWGGVPERAVDGKRCNTFSKASCTHTRTETGPWWRLDLQKTFSISTVTVTNRGDCCHTRINGAEIHIGNSLQGNGNKNPRCAVISSLPAGGSVTFACRGMEGRYVNIVIPGRHKILTLCDVQVTGTEASPDVCG